MAKDFKMTDLDSSDTTRHTSLDDTVAVATDVESSVVMTDSGRKILEALDVRPALDLIDLASSAHITPSAAKRTLDALQAQGIVVATRSGRNGPDTEPQERLELDRNALRRHLQGLVSAGA